MDLSWMKLSGVAAAAVVLATTAGGAANAQNKWTGQQAATYSGSSIFSISGSTITITAGSGNSYLNFGSGPQQLLSVGGLWIVNSSGGTVTGVTANTSSITGTSATTTWSAETNPAGFGAKSGYSPSGTWVDLVSNATLTQYGKSPDGYNNAVLTFNNLSSLNSYDLGIDYMITDGTNSTKTGRAYFTIPTTQVSGVPEPSSWAAMALGVCTLGGLILLKRRAILQKSA